jgi:Phage portal protein, SPP1 Gp6-like
VASYSDENGFVNRYKTRFNLDVDNDWSHRQARLFILQEFLNGTIYDKLQPFHIEYTGSDDNGKYVPIMQRRPSVIYRIPKIIVNASVSMLFGEGHFPVPRCEGDEKHEKTTKFLQYITRACDLRSVMLDAAKKGSIGSVVILVKVLEGHFYFESIHSIHINPIFKRSSPKELLSLTEKKKIDGATLKSHGYEIPEDDIKVDFYVMREWNENEEIYYKPYKVDKDQDKDFKPVKDNERSTLHELGFVPAIWIKNLPKSGGIDGHSTFEDILDICIEIDYQLSQHARLLRYNSDPTLVVKNATTLEGRELVKGLGSLNLDEKGDAYLLEITTGATKSVIEYVSHLREIALETVRGNRSSPDKLHSAASGEALKMLNFELVSLVEEMRLTYGEYGLMQVYIMVLRIVKSDKFELDLGEYMPESGTDCEGHIMLDWPAWYPPSGLDQFNEAKTLSILVKDGIISHETATKTVSDEYNILDVEKELSNIEEHEANMYDKEASLKGINENSGSAGA